MADEYISKEAFTNWIDETFCKKCEAEKRDYHHCRCGSCEYDYMRCDIESFPAADVAPVVRGKWVNYGDEYRPDIRCCVCGQRKPILLGNFNFNFCSNCGADMREVDNA